LVVCFDKIYIALSLKEVVQFKYINLCGGGLGEKMRVQFSAQVSSEVIANTTPNIIEKLNTSKDFRPKKFREIQVILSEDQLIWFYQTFLLKSRTQISPVVLTNHTEEFMKLKFVPNFISQNKKPQDFLQKRIFQKPVEKISNFLSIVIKIYQGELFIKYLLRGGKTNDQAIVLKNTKSLDQTDQKNNFFIEMNKKVSVFIVISLVLLLISLLYVLYSRRIITNNLKICNKVKSETVTKLQNVKQVIPELKQKIAKQTETIQSLGTHLQGTTERSKKQIHTLEKDVQGKSERLKSLMEKINRICETKENWDPDCEEFKGSKALHKMTGKQNSVTEKTNKDFIEKLRKGQTEFFDSGIPFFFQA
jgi:uncharacterized protein YoxC